MQKEKNQANLVMLPLREAKLQMQQPLNKAKYSACVFCILDISLAALSNEFKAQSESRLTARESDQLPLMIHSRPGLAGGSWQMNEAIF